jgi:hypothetical protein
MRLLAAATALALALLPATGPIAAEPAKAAPVNGTVASVSGVRVEMTVDGEKATWVKRGAGIKVKGGLGKIVGVTATTITFNTKKASELKAGDKVVIEKGNVVPAGC